MRANLLYFLIVENNQTEALLLHAYLKEIIFHDLPIKIKGTYVMSLAETKAALQKQDFDLILLDLGLDDSFGLSTLEEVVKLTDTPILVITGSYYPGDDVERLGAKGYLYKTNLSKENLHANIEACLNSLLAGKVKRIEKHCRQIDEFNSKINTSLGESDTTNGQ